MRKIRTYGVDYMLSVCHIAKVQSFWQLGGNAADLNDDSFILFVMRFHHISESLKKHPS